MSPRARYPLRRLRRSFTDYSQRAPPSNAQRWPKRPLHGIFRQKFWSRSRWYRKIDAALARMKREPKVSPVEMPEGIG